MDGEDVWTLGRIPYLFLEIHFHSAVSVVVLGLLSGIVYEGIDIASR